MRDDANSPGTAGGEPPSAPPPPHVIPTPMLDPVPDSLASRVMRRLVSLEKKVGDLKPTFSTTLITEVGKIAFTAGAMLLATLLTGRLNQENTRIAATANAREAQRIKDFPEALRELAEARSTFQNYFVNAEATGVTPDGIEFMKADVNLVRQIRIRLIPSVLKKKLDEFRIAAGTGKEECDSAKDDDERKTRAKVTRKLLDQKITEIDAAFDQALGGPG